VRDAIAAAALVMHHSHHTLLVGEQASQFAVEMGLERSSLATSASLALHATWVEGGCQPNFRKNVRPDAKSSCGPYKRGEQPPLFAARSLQL